jgi:hypothetical protein
MIQHRFDSLHNGCPLGPIAHTQIAKTDSDRIGSLNLG